VVIASGYVIQELFSQGVGGLSVALGVQGGTGGAVALPSGGTVASSAKTPSVVNATALLAEVLGPGVAAGVNESLNRLGLVLWRSGIQILLFLAALQGISRSLYEAGRIDGASEWVLFWRVTLPIISPVMLAVVVFTVVDSFMDTFNNPILDYVRKTAFERAKYGYAAALSWIYFLLVFAVLIVLLALMRRRVFYRGER
jgi:ABC-type sugar transport system permease subunit